MTLFRVAMTYLPALAGVVLLVVVWAAIVAVMS